MWNEYLRSVEKSQTLLLNEQSRNLESSGHETFKFGFGQSPFPPLDAATAALRAHAAAKDYTSVQGLPALCAKVAEFHQAVDLIDVTPDQVLIAPGSKILIYSVMAAFEQADVLIAAPAWVSYAPQARLLGHTAIKVDTDFEHRWRVRPEALEAAVKAKAHRSVPTLLILNYPGNPDGLSYSDQELKLLAETLRKHNILVVSDEIYGLLHHTGQHVSLARHYPEGSIVTSGLSKWCGAGGWRLGVALLPQALRGAFKDTLLGIASETYSCAALPVQMAACEAYQWNDETRDYLAHQRRLLASIGNWLADQLIAANVRVHKPTGGFYLFPDFSNQADKMYRSGIHSSHDLCARLLADTGVALLPGVAFGMSPEQLCARLAYVEFDGREALKASREIGLDRPIDANALQAIFPKTIRGTHKLVKWLASF
jgi:aspartate aminotransferase